MIRTAGQLIDSMANDLLIYQALTANVVPFGTAVREQLTQRGLFSLPYGTD